MFKKAKLHTTLAIVALSAAGLGSQARAQGANLSGAYRCQPAPAPCMWAGQTASISQTGKDIQIKNDKGEVAAAKLTSDITISAGGPVNTLGIVRPDHSIEWSNGTTWRKQ